VTRLRLKTLPNGTGLGESAYQRRWRKFVISQLVGIATETIAMAIIGSKYQLRILGGKTPAERLEELKRRSWRSERCQ